MSNLENEREGEMMGVRNIVMDVRNVVMPRLKNLFASRSITSLPLEQIEQELEIPLRPFSVDRQALRGWAEAYVPLVVKHLGTPFHKKILELYTTHELLQIEREHSYLDAAGGVFSYAANVACEDRYLVDIAIQDSLKKELQGKVHQIEASVTRIPLPDESIDRISCHHSLEHFQKDADKAFIREVQRLLKKGGRCAIIPIFISDNHYLLTNKVGFPFWEERGKKVLDITATLPGGGGSGHFARVYSPSSLKERILGQIDLSRFKVELHYTLMDEVEIPRKGLFLQSHHAPINMPYRVLLIKRTV